jgi:hypothetical protein
VVVTGGVALFAYVALVTVASLPAIARDVT